MAAAAAAALAATGVAIAAGLGAFDGIGAAQHPQAGADVIDPATAAYLEGRNCNRLPDQPSRHCQPIIAGLLLDTARLVDHLPSGQDVYVITSAHENLCTVVGPPQPEWECDDPLSRSHPTTVFTYGNDGPPWTTLGVALDGVTAVSFQSDGHEVTVPVESNLWTYEGREPPGITGPVTAHFDDGSTVVWRG